MPEKLGSNLLRGKLAMHRSSQERFNWFFKHYKDYLLDLGGGSIKMLDVGGKNYNGTYEDILLGTNYKKDILDILEGPEVTYIPEDPYCWSEIQDETYDFVYSAQTFQHINYFWLTICEMKRVLKTNGILLIIAPSVRYEGKYPVANWAFNKDGLYALANWADLEVIDASVAGVPDQNSGYEWDDPLDDAMLIAVKGRGVKDDKIFPENGKLIVQRKCTNESADKVAVLNRWLELYQNTGCGIIGWFQKMKIDKINLYGAGDLGEKILNEVSDSDIRVANLIDCNSPKFVRNYVSCTLDEVKKEDRKYPTIVALAARHKIADIVNDLKKNGFTKIILLSDILEDLTKKEGK